MLRTLLNLECDGCGNPYPSCGVCPAPVNGAIYTSKMLRSKAKADGWVRSSLEGTRTDICPRCAKKENRKGSK